MASIVLIRVATCQIIMLPDQGAVRYVQPGLRYVFSALIKLRSNATLNRVPSVLTHIAISHLENLVLGICMVEFKLHDILLHGNITSIADFKSSFNIRVAWPVSLFLRLEDV